MNELSQLIASNPDPRELKRALAVKMRLQGDTYKYIADTLQVSHGFIAYWQQAYQAQGVAGVKLAYKGSQPYLNAQQQQAVITWLKQRNYWHLPELQHHIEEVRFVQLK